jgi:hypothetical protein
MGGNVFTDLTVPRLPHEVYHLIRKQCHEALKPFYTDVLSPPEAPDKQDHGDVDFLVARPSVSAMPAAEIAKAFGAAKYKHTTNSKTTHFALRIPDRDNEFAQVDVHVCPDDYFEWETFLQSYGDLMQIVGILNRPIGLTANDKGLYLRIPEIEPKNRKKAMVFLTSNPREMMQFLRLGVEKYYSGFATNEEIFHWCLSGELYSAPKVKEETTNDRNRLRKRDMFTTCIRGWFPKHQDALFPPTRRIWTREKVLQEALTTFAAARPVYDAAMAEHKQEEWESGILAAMRTVGPEQAEEKDISEVVRGTKRFVDFADARWMVSDVVLREDVGRMPAWIGLIKTEDEKMQFLGWLREQWNLLHQRERDRMRMEEEARTTARVDTPLYNIS